MKKHILNVTMVCGIFGATLLADEKVDKKNMAKESITANDVKIEANVRFVETFTVMGEGALGQEYRRDIESKRDLATETIQDEAKNIEKAKIEYSSKASTMSDAAREKEEKKLMKMERDLKNMVAEKEEELKVDMQVATEKLVQDMEAAVIELAQQEDIDIVFDKMTGRAIYVSEEFDFTDKVIKKVNENYNIKVAQNKQQQETLKVVDNKKATADKTVKS